MPSPLTILVVHNHYQQRGGEDSVFETECAMLRGAGHTVICYEKHNDDICAPQQGLGARGQGLAERESREWRVESRFGRGAAPDPVSFDPSDYAMAGVSLYLAHPDNSATNIVAKGWAPVHESSAFKFYRNPAFTSRILATTPTGETHPVTLDAETANTRTFTLPPGTHSVHIAETFNKGWTALANGDRIPIQKSDRNGMTLDFEDPLASPLQISMRYRPWPQPVYLPVTLATLVSLGAVCFMLFLRRR